MRRNRLVIVMTLGRIAPMDQKHFNTFIIASRVVKPNAQLDTTSKARGDVGNARYLDEIERPSRILTPPSPLLPFDCLQKRRKTFPVVV